MKKWDQLNWKTCLTELFGPVIKYQGMDVHLLEQVRSGVLFPICSCSGLKTERQQERYFPHELYCSNRCANFFQWCFYLKMEYAVLSDKYGLFFWDEKKPGYDLHPSKLTEKDFEDLGARIKKQCQKREIKKLLLVGENPTRCFPYFKMLFHSKVPTIYCNNLNLNSGKEKKNETLLLF